MPQKKRNLGIRADEKRWKALNHLATDRDTSVQGLVDEAIDRAFPVLSRGEKVFIILDGVDSGKSTASTSQHRITKNDDFVRKEISRIVEKLQRIILIADESIESINALKNLTGDSYGKGSGNAGKKSKERKQLDELTGRHSPGEEHPEKSDEEERPPRSGGDKK